MVNENPKIRFLSAWQKEESVGGMRILLAKRVMIARQKTKQADICF